MNGEAVDTKPNMDEEWPEDDVKPKKGKKGKKDKGRKATAGDEEGDEDVQMEEAPEKETAGLEATKVNMDDEWPEEDVKPKKGKKGKKGKGGKVDDDEEEEQEKEQPVEEEVKAAAPKVEEKVEPPAGEEDEEEEDAGPKVRLIMGLQHMLST